VDPNSVVTEAEVIATAFDGGGGSEVRDRSGRIGFSEFLRTVSARDSNSDSGRAGRGDAFQDTEILSAGDEELGVDSQGTASGSFTDPTPGDETQPVGSGRSELIVDFDVVGDPVKFSLTGELNASGSPTNSQCSNVRLVSPSGLNTDTVGACDGSAAEVEINEIGELQPGTHRLSVEMYTPAFNPLASGGTAVADYDIKLRFCTITVAAPDQETDGTAGDDVICGTPGDDTIFGLGGKDRIFGLTGADILDGGAAADSIDGGDGDDLRIYGGTGNDTIDAGPGNDGPGAPQADLVVAGGPGDDQIDGGTGNDQIFGRCGEEVFGDPSDICLADPVEPGENDDDNLTGDRGNDVIFGDAGINFIRVGAGNDSAAAGDLGDTLIMGAGADSALGGVGDDQIEGGAGDDDTVLGGLAGFGGNDTITGGTGDDLLEGGSARDCLVGGSARDVFRGGDGEDTLLAKDGARDSVNGGASPDRGRFDPDDSVTSVQRRNFSGGC
jgi:Ca2+-binding RTX toxin-like protein